MDIELNKYFDEFMEIYKADKIHFSWRKNSYVISSEEKAEKELRKFVSGLVNVLRQKILKESIDDEYKKYEKYADELLEYDPEIKADIITRCGSNINICNYINYEILTKRNKKLEPQCYSALINLNIEQPNSGKDLLKQINFELSIKDLKLFYRVLGEAIEDIENLNKMNKL